MERNSWRVFLLSNLLCIFSNIVYAQWTDSGTNLTTTDNVGIGTSTPGSKLDINSTASGSSLRLLGENLDLDFIFGHVGDAYGYYWRYKGTQSGNDNDLELWSQNLQGSDILIYRTKQDGTFSFLREVSFGNTQVPAGYQLAVDGKAIMEEVQVEVSTSWPDYVFSDNYQLRTLEETEQYIKEFRHLPNIPTAKEVEKEGIALGEMNALLLEKIEELTLYQIELMKVMKLQQEQINDQKDEIERIKSNLK